MEKIPLVAVENAITGLNTGMSLFLQSAKSGTNRNGLFLDAIRQTETVCYRARQIALSYADSPQQRSAILEQSQKNLGITVEVTNEEFLHITLPCILPNKKDKRNIGLITEPLRYALSQTPNIPFRREKQTLVVQHNYRPDTPDRLFRDHDNFETKRIIDTVAPFCMPDDSVKYCELFYISSVAEINATEIWVLPAAKLLDWVKIYKK